MNDTPNYNGNGNDNDDYYDNEHHHNNNNNTYSPFIQHILCNIERQLTTTINYNRQPDKPV